MRKQIGTVLFYLASAASLVQAQPSPAPSEQINTPPPVARSETTDLSGKWYGTVEILMSGGGTGAKPMYLFLRQEGTALRGYGGTDFWNPAELSNGKIEDNKVSFDLVGHAVLRAKLIEEGDRLVGDLSAPGMSMLKLSLKRVSYPTAEKLRAPLATIDAMVTAEFAKRPTGSVTIGAVCGRQLIWWKSYGNADTEKKMPATKDTVYRIGSITKLFTAVMLHQLIDNGKVHLSDPVEKYFTEVSMIPRRFPNAPPITLVQLATHTAGLSDDPYVVGPVSEWEKALITRLPHSRYEFEPGTRRFYSNIGYSILGAALSRAAGKSYQEYIQDAILEPLGMTRTALEPNTTLQPYLSKGYEVKGEKIDTETPQREHQGRGFRVPGGAIYTTVGDLARFASFLLGEPPESASKRMILQRGFWQQPVQADIDLSTDTAPGFQRFGAGTLLPSATMDTSPDIRDRFL